MVESILQTFRDLVLNLSGRRLFYFFVIFLTIILGLYIYEWYTASLYLTRLEKITNILSKIQSIDANIEPGQYALKEISGDISKQLKDNIRVRELITPSLGIKKVFMAFLPWLIFSLIFIPSIKRKETNALLGVFGVLFFGIIAIIIGICLPQIGAWFNYIIYPWGLFIAIVFSLMTWNKMKGKSNAR
jgi:hypothetical protein